MTNIKISQIKRNINKFRYLYLIFNVRIIVIKTIETVFAAIMGILSMSKPYVNHVIKPNSSIITIGKEISLVCLVLMPVNPVPE